MAYSDEVLADAPLAYWQMEEASGTVLVDSSGNNRNGTWSGTPTFGAAGLVGEGTSTQFSGDDYASIADVSWMPKAAFTYEFAASRDALAAGGIFYLLVQQGVFSSYVYDDLTVEISAGGVYVTGGSWAAGADTHVAFVYDGAAMLVYVNGTQVASSAKTGALAASTSPLYIGRGVSSMADAFAGRMGNVAIYGAALSPARISAHANAMGATPPPPPTPIDTATPYANDGYNYGGGVSEVDFDPPIAVSPARIRPALIRRVHQSIPAPTLVEGRPV